MCGIAGFSSYEEDYGICRGKWEEILETMNQVQKRRGPDEDGIFLDAHCGMVLMEKVVVFFTATFFTD